MKKIILIVLITGAFITPTIAQSSFSVQYSLSFGGNLNEYVGTSVRGVTMEYKFYPQPNLGIGIDASWNRWYERRPFDSYTSGTLTVSGVQYRYADAVPIFVTTDYYFKPGANMNPFIGLGIGTMFLDRYVDMGVWRISEDDWHFALKPEVGVLVSANPDMDIIFAFRYNNAFATTDTQDQQFMSFNVGFVWK